MPPRRSNKKQQHDANDTLAMLPWFWRDWLAGNAKAVMSLECQGAYRNLIDRQWSSPDCMLPNDDDTLRAYAGATEDEWLRVRSRIMAWFDATDDGKLFNKRVRFEWKKSRSGRAEKRQRSKEAANARWTKEKAGMQTQCTSIADALPKACPPSPSPTPSPSPSPINNPTPFVTGPDSPKGIRNRPAVEQECNQLAIEVADLTGKDPAEVMAKASEWKGSVQTNVANMTEGRLVNTLMRLRSARDKAVAESRPIGSGVAAQMAQALREKEARKLANG